MRLEGSCHCGAVRFVAQSVHPCPYMRCYCSICRKTAGAGGYGINIKADYATLEVEGREHLRDFHATIRNPGKKDRKSVGERFFCGQCGSPLWVWDRRWPEMFHPHASAIDTPLPEPPSHTHIMLEFKASWVQPNIGPGDKTFDRYPDESIAAWHERMGLEIE
jgi:hypothetical protein